MDEGDRLESDYTVTRIEGSNPSLAAIFFKTTLWKQKKENIPKTSGLDIYSGQIVNCYAKKGEQSSWRC